MDLDTLVESTLRGLGDAQALQPRFAGLDAILATKRFGPVPQALVGATSAAAIANIPQPGQQLLDAHSPDVPRPGDRDAKRAWRDRLAAAWGDQPPAVGDVWIDLALGLRGSLLGPLEVALDALEPVLGRDPRGRSWQEFFPNDHIVVWLRVRRDPNAAGLILRLGPFHEKLGT